VFFSFDALLYILLIISFIHICSFLSLFSLFVLSLNVTLLSRFHFSWAETLFAAEQQLEAAQGVNDTPFVTMKLTVDEKGQIIVEAYQVIYLFYCQSFFLLVICVYADAASFFVMSNAFLHLPVFNCVFF